MYYNLPYACTTSAAKFRLILLLKVTPACTLHSRVEDYVTYISIVNCSSNLKGALLYNVNYDPTILCKTIILVINYVEFFKVWL